MDKYKKATGISKEEIEYFLRRMPSADVKQSYLLELLLVALCTIVEKLDVIASHDEESSTQN